LNEELVHTLLDTINQQNLVIQNLQQVIASLTQQIMMGKTIPYETSESSSEMEEETMNQLDAIIFEGEEE
jgi:hypothetical protein